MIKLVKWLSALILLLFGWYLVRPTFYPSVAVATPQMKAYALQVEILRDNWGIPHIKAETNNAATFGLAYAHSEDDFPLIMANAIAARGKLSLVELSELSLANDYLVQLLGLAKKVDAQFELLPIEFQVFLQAYADGLNYYAALHPSEVDSRVLPFEAKDILAGYVHKLPLMMGVGGVIQDIFARDNDELIIGTPIQKRLVSTTSYPQWSMGQLAGSNAHAVHASRSNDNVTRLNINSHQPWEGPVAWYEAHILSAEGWNMIGGTFPGSPYILHGHNQTLGWAHTVNKPDFTDVYRLTMREDGSRDYRLDGKWKPLKEGVAKLEVDLGLFNWTFDRPIYASEHGPVIEKNGAYYAIRYAGFDRHGAAALQWYEMNMAENFQQWKKAMSRQGLAMMNTVYADKDNIYYVYNALLPLRVEGPDWLTILPGDDSSLIWQKYLPYQQLPQIENPESGWLMNTNATPFQASTGSDNPLVNNYSKTFGIETVMNNRAIRSHELFGVDEDISKQEFLTYKFDQKYSQHSAMFKDVLLPLLGSYQPEGEAEAKAFNILAKWDGEMAADSNAASLAKLIYEPILKAKMFMPLGTEVPSAIDGFKYAIDFLLKNYGSVDVPLAQLQKLRRGDLVLGLGGGADTLNSVHTKTDGKYLIGTQGDSYISIVDFSDNGVSSLAIHQYGNVNRGESVHYNDQAELFVKRKLRKSLLTEEEIRANLSRAYHPGEELNH